MSLIIFFSGIFVGTFFTAGLFFLKFWKASRDSFFRYFAIACWLLCIERILAIYLEIHSQSITTNSETMMWVYLIRLAAFILIISAIIKKNKRTT